MKKSILTLSVILLTAMSAFAGGGKTNNRPLATKFSQNWFIDASGTLNAWQGSDRAAYVDFNTIYYKNTNNGLNFGGSLKIGKMVSPVFGLRIGFDANKATNQYGDFFFQYIHADGMVSLFDLFGGYKPDRFFNMVLVGGFGYANHGESWFNLNGNKEYAANLGLVNNFRLANSLDLHLDLNAVAPRWSIETVNPIPDSRYTHFNFSGGLGLTWYFCGRHFDFCEECQEVAVNDCSKQENTIKDLQERIVELEQQLNNSQNSNTPCDTIVKFAEGESLSYPFSIFFNKGSYDLRDGRDIVNLQEFANAAKENGYKIVLRGTCDSATASSAFNRTLAENRCNKIKAELVKLGVPESNITINPVGGVKELTPAEYDRRVLIQLSK